MPLEIGIWRIDAGTKALDARGLDVENRLEEILDENISVLNPNWMVVGRQVRTSYGKIIDLLCMDRDGNLAAVELKRDMTERDTVAQALDYGSWVRQLKDDDLARIFDGYRRNYHREKQPVSINDAFCQHFNLRQMPEELNESHELVIVGSSLDPATERIVQYLSDEYGVRINAVFFRVFRDGDREYLSRVWLREPTEVDAGAEETRRDADWNGEYYVSFGHDSHGRNWEDAVKYGFFSAGGGTWYSQTLRLLEPNARIWVNIPATGYVGVGVVEAPSVKVDEFLVDVPGKGQVPITQAPLKSPGIGQNAEDPVRAEYLVRVRWLKTVSVSQAIKERGFFGNQNSVARPTTPSWVHTVQRLRERFGIS